MNDIEKQSISSAAGLPPLLVEALRVAHSVQLGLHGRRRVGGGEAFWQFRPYDGSCSSHLIDWRQSARGDTLYVRQREAETVQTVYLWADASGSMHYKSRKDLPEKTERAHVIQLALAHLLLRGGERVVWLRKVPISARTASGFSIMAANALPPPLEEASYPPEIGYNAHSYMVICGDFLSDLDGLKRALRLYASLNMRGALVQIVDPLEADPAFSGRIKLSGLENEHSLLLPDAASAREGYKKHFAQHCQVLQELAEGIGWSYFRHLTDAPPVPVLLSLIQVLTSRR